MVLDKFNKDLKKTSQRGNKEKPPTKPAFIKEWSLHHIQYESTPPLTCLFHSYFVLFNILF